MVDYNKQKLDAIKLIDSFAEKNKFSKEDICFYVMKTLGFGDKFVLNYIQQCIDRKYFIEDKYGIIGQTTKEERE